MAMVTSQELKRAVAEAVDQVNTHSGRACVHLRFNSADLPELEFLANSARLMGEKFLFTSGFETYDGSIEELASIRTEVIG
jgi:hypothetical protein